VEAGRWLLVQRSDARWSGVWYYNRHQCFRSGIEDQPATKERV